MGADDSPLRVHHPLEHKYYHALSSAPVDLLNAFMHLLDENLSKCLVVDQRCSSNVDHRSVLLGRALCELRSNVRLRQSIVTSVFGGW